MQRIAVWGCSGAGKSTLARDLGALLGLPVRHLDQAFWLPGWVESDRERFAAIQRQWVAEDSWVIDGNYSSTYDLRLARADAVVLLDLPRRTCLRRVLWRWARGRGRTRATIARDCPERLDGEFLRYVWGYRRTHRPRALAALERAGATGVATCRLRSPGEVRRFVEEVAGESSGAGATRPGGGV